MTSQPHASWAEVYDKAYEHSFGSFYEWLTDKTLAVIQQRFPTGAALVDFGAGTGRLSIPLAQAGYAVTAVEPCPGMLEQLQKKAQCTPIEGVCSPMAGFRGNRSYDGAICVFTVIIYLLEETDLSNSLQAARDCLKPGGLLLLDVPSEGLFHGYSAGHGTLERSVVITDIGNSRYRYEERITLRDAGGRESHYADTFTIRHWRPGHVRAELEHVGFRLEEDLSDEFQGSGSQYWLMRKV